MLYGMISPHLIFIDVYLDKIKPRFGDSRGFFFDMTLAALIARRYMDSLRTSPSTKQAVEWTPIQSITRPILYSILQGSMLWSGRLATQDVQGTHCLTIAGSPLS